MLLLWAGSGGGDAGASSSDGGGWAQQDVERHELACTVYHTLCDKLGAYFFP